MTIDAETIIYVDQAVDDVRRRGSVRVATTISLVQPFLNALRAGQQIDDVVLALGDLVLVKNQGVLSKNGIYLVGAAGAAEPAPTRFSEYNAWGHFLAATVSVGEGTLNRGTMWRCTAASVGILETDAIEFKAIDDIDALLELPGTGLTASQSLLIHDAGLSTNRVDRHRRVNAQAMTASHLVQLIGAAPTAAPLVPGPPPEGDYSDLNRSDSMPLLIDGALRRIDPLSLQQFVQGTPWALDPKGVISMTATIQAKADSLLIYAEVAAGALEVVQPTGISTVSVAVITLDSAWDRRFMRCTPIDVAPSVTTVKLPEGLPVGVECYVALMGSGTVTLKANNLAFLNGVSKGTLNITNRFDAVKVVCTAANTYETTPIAVIGGGTLRLPAGVFLIDGVGLKWHPANNLLGAGMAGTVLLAAPALTGKQDNAASQTPGMLTVVARSHPSSYAGDPVWSWQPTISDVTLLGTNLALEAAVAAELRVCGLVIENGNTDPAYASLPANQEYKASSARILSCGVYEFPGHGVFSQGERQRFYCQHLRSVSNGGYGLQIRGADPVIGERTGLGSNGLHQLSCGSNAGVIVTGVNMWKGKVRTDDCLACEISDVNGCTITGCVFNDTLVLIGKPGIDFFHKGVSITGCDFRPNDEVFSANGVTTPPLASGGASDSRNAYIYVNGLANVTVGDNSFCVQADTYSYKRILYAENRARVSLSAAVSTEAGVRNFADSHPVSIGPLVVGVSPVVSYDLRDIYRGTRITGTLIDTTQTPVAPLAPQVRGLVDPALIDDITAFAGYRIYDGGPLVQGYAPEFTDAATQIIDNASSSVTVDASARLAIINVPAAGLPTLAVTLPTTSYHRHLTVLLRGGDVKSLLWSSGAATLPDLAWMPSRTFGRATVELVRRRGASPQWMVLRADEDDFRLLMPYGLDTTELTPANTTVAKVSMRAPRKMRIVEVRGALATAATAASPLVTVDVRRRIGPATWESVFTTLLTFDKDKLTTLTAANPAALNPLKTLIDADQELGLFVTAAPATVTAKGLKVWLVGRLA